MYKLKQRIFVRLAVYLIIWIVCILCGAYAYAQDQNLDSSIVFLSREPSSVITNLYVSDATGSQVTPLIYTPLEILQPSIASDGSRIVFVAFVQRIPHILSVNSDGTNLINLTAGNGRNFQPSWSPDGTKIAFMSVRNGNPNNAGDIYVMDADGSNQIRLTDGTSDNQQPAWSPDGSKIIFTTNRDGYYTLYTMNADGSDPQPAMEHNSSAINAADARYSPDGSKIAFIYYFGDDRIPQIAVMDADGSNQELLTTDFTIDENPRWSPDGNEILFVRGVSGVGPQLYVMNTDGSNIRPFFEENNTLPNPVMPDWGVLSSSILEDDFATIDPITDEPFALNATLPLRFLNPVQVVDYPIAWSLASSQEGAGASIEELGIIFASSANSMFENVPLEVLSLDDVSRFSLFEMAQSARIAYFVVNEGNIEINGQTAYYQHLSIPGDDEQFDPGIFITLPVGEGEFLHTYGVIYDEPANPYLATILSMLESLHVDENAILLDCTVSASQNVNLRGGPGTNFDVVGQLNGGTQLSAQAQTTDSQNFIWFHLSNDAWVRSDVISASDDCFSLPEFGQNANATETVPSEEVQPLPTPTNSTALVFTELEVEIDQGNYTFSNTNMENFTGTLPINRNPEELHYLGELSYGDTLTFTSRQVGFNSEEILLNGVPHLVTFEGQAGDVVAIQLDNPGTMNSLTIAEVIGPSGSADNLPLEGYRDRDRNSGEELRVLHTTLRDTGTFTIPIVGNFYSSVEPLSYTLSLELLQAAQQPVTVVATTDPAVFSDRTIHPDLTEEDLQTPLIPVSGEWELTETNCNGEVQTFRQTLYVLNNGQMIIRKHDLGEFNLYSYHFVNEPGFYDSEWSVHSPDFIESNFEAVNCVITGFYELITINTEPVQIITSPTPDLEIGNEVSFSASVPILIEPNSDSRSVRRTHINLIGTILDGPVVNDDPLPGTTWWQVHVSEQIGDVTLENEGWIPASILNDIVIATN